VQGVVWEQGFEEGTSVTAGQFLFLIDPRPFEADLQIAEAQTYQAKVAVQSAERDLNRTRSLQASASVAREELDDAISLYETNVAAMRLAEAQLVKARLELSYTTVTAPVRGLVGRAMKKTGDLVDSGANSLMVTITTQNPMYVIFSAAEKDLLDRRNSIEAGFIVPPENEEYDVEIVLLDGTVYGHTGRINFRDVEIDPMTGTGQIRAEFPNPDNLLQPGQFVEVRLKGARRTGATVVPQNAVMQGMQGSYVYVVGEDKKVEMRPVTPTIWEGQNWIIEDGLSPGDRVIIAGTNKTAPGAEVNVTTVTETLDFESTGTATE
jgi:membrane fusion protein (multidrug efflux system)